MLLIRALSGKCSRLTEVPFWDCPEGIFSFYCPAALERTVPYSVHGFPFTGLRNVFTQVQNPPESVGPE